MGLDKGAPHWMQFSLQVCSVPQYSHFTVTVSGGGGGAYAVVSDKGRWTLPFQEPARVAPIMIMTTTKAKNRMKMLE